MNSLVSNQLEERFIRFSVTIIRYTQTHAEIPPPVCDQIIRSSSSIGANYAEAQNAVSRADFRNKIFIAKKEAAETRYWLQIISEITDHEEVSGLLRENQEIILILQKIVTTLKERSAT